MFSFNVLGLLINTPPIVITKDKIKGRIQLAGAVVLKDITPKDIKNCFLVYQARTELANMGMKVGELLLKGAYPSIKELDSIRTGRPIARLGRNDKNEP